MKTRNLEAEWLQLVHEGACCALDDENQEEKQRFIKAVQEQTPAHQNQVHAGEF